MYINLFHLPLFNFAYLFFLRKLQSSKTEPSSVQFSHSVVSDSLRPHELQHASLSITNSQNPPKPMSIESVMTSNHLILCHPLLFLPSIVPSIRVFSNFFDDCHSDWCEMIPHCGFDLHYCSN